MMQMIRTTELMVIVAIIMLITVVLQTMSRMMPVVAVADVGSQAWCS